MGGLRLPEHELAEVFVGGQDHGLIASCPLKNHIISGPGVAVGDEDTRVAIPLKSLDDGPADVLVCDPIHAARLSRGYTTSFLST